MQAIEQDVLEHALGWLEAGRRAWLATIVAAVGSSPRPVGALLSCNDAGEQCGSLSGGCIEEDLLARIRDGRMATHGPEVVEYGVTAEENERLGLPCGGRLHVLVQPLALEADGPWMRDVVGALGARRCIRRTVDLATGETRADPAERFAALHRDETAITQTFGPRMRLLLIGAGHLAQAVSELALAMDYEVLVNDPRAHVLEQWEGPPVKRIPGMPDDAVAAHADDPHSIVITLTHDPRIDDMALMEALVSKAWYVGALGSARTSAKRVARLRELDLPEERIARLHAPVGLAIGSKTPAEIAVAILAELTQLRRQAAA